VFIDQGGNGGAILAAMLVSLIEDPAADIAAIARYLDGQDDPSREVLGLRRAQQRTLYEKAAQSPPIELAHFANGSGEERHAGRNTLPVPPMFKRFEKRFARADAARVFGYNDGATLHTIGPGYFVAVTTQGRPAWESRGAVVIDYFQVPDGAVPAGWPRVRENRVGLQRFVYAGTRDFMRRVSQRVAIGAAYKGERPLDHYFVLCRRN